MEALNARASARLFSEKELSLQQLSDMLWAAWASTARLMASALLRHHETCRRWMYMSH
jgi:hypothetical protein